MSDARKQPAPAPARALAGRRSQLAYRLLAAALAVCVALSLLSDAFLTTSNLLNVLRQASLLFLIARA